MSGAPPAFLSGPVSQALAAALLHFLWQGALVALLLAVLDRAWRGEPRRRYAAACGALFLLVVLPVGTFLRLRSVRAAEPVAAVVETSEKSPPLVVARRGAVAQLAAVWTRWRAFPRRYDGAGPWLLAAWAAGVLLFSIRLSAAWLAAQRLRRRRTRPAASDATRVLAALAARFGIHRPVRLLESAAVAVPTALGVLRPVVLLPFAALTGLSAGQLEALLAHELAHIRRHDYLVNLGQCVAETLLFYHPAVWWVSHRIRVEREKCCDDLAVAALGDPRAYARALVDLAGMRVAAPRLALAADGGGPLWNRVTRLFPSVESPADAPPRRLAGLFALAALLVVGAAGRIVYDVDADFALPRGGAGARSHSPGIAPARPAAERAAFSRGRGDAGGAPKRVMLAAAGEAQQDERAAAEPDLDEPAAEDESETAEPDTQHASFDREELRELARHGVTSEFVHAIAALGYERASTDELVSLRIHGVTPELLSELKAYFGRLVPLETAVELRIHGISRDYLARLSGVGLSKLSAEHAVELRTHGVTPEYVRAFSDAGYREISVEEAVSLRIHGVDPKDAPEWIRVGFPRPTLEDLTTLRIHGVDPRYAEELRAAGVRAGALEELVSLRTHGVTPDFARRMSAQGVALPSADDAVTLRIHGVTPEFVAGFRELGYKSASTDDWTSLAIHGVTADWAKRVNRARNRRLSIDELIDARIHGTGGER